MWCEVRHQGRLVPHAGGPEDVGFTACDSEVIMKPDGRFLARWREARRARAQRRRESRHHAATSANMDRLSAETRIAANDRHRAYGSIFGGD